MHKTRQGFFLLALWLTAIMAQAQAVVTLPRTSPRAQFSQTFGITTVTIDYGAPKVKAGNNDRTGKIWGQQVPYDYQKINFAGQGEIPWRAGADENTTIHFSTDVKIDGQPLAAGTYGLHMAIHKDNTATLIFSNNTTSWGSFWYHEKDDALRVKVDTEDIPFENVLNYRVTELDGLYARFALSWEKKRIAFNVEANTLDLMADNLEKELYGSVGFGWQGKFQAARYLARYNHRMDLAEKWLNESITAQKNFQNMFLKSTILFQKGDKEALAAILDEASQLADINELNQLGYTLMQNQMLDKAVEYFELNVKRNPTDANVYNSLGEALVAKGEKKKAIKLFKKSNTLNPTQVVKDSNDQNLASLGVK